MKENKNTEPHFNERQVQTSEQECVALLKEKKLTVSTMESCTGGMVAARFINVAGVSDVFKAGYTTYSDEAKNKILGVKETTLEKYTAVSAEVAEEMVLGPALQIKPDVAISVTGIAGPDGGTDEKPVGLVYIGCRVKERVKTLECRFDGDRMQIREAATETALNLMKQCVVEYFKDMEIKGN